MAGKTKFLSIFCAAALAVNSAALGAFAEENEIGDERAVIYRSEESALIWATQIGQDKEMWSDAPSGLALGDNGFLYICSADNIYKVNKLTGKIAGSGKMAGQAAYASKGPAYAEGMVFMAMDGGTVQAFDANTLESKWIYRNKLGGSPTCDIIYNEGNIFTGFWNGETEDADYVSIDISDSDPTRGDEEKLADWEYTNKGGFYWTSIGFLGGRACLGSENGLVGPTDGGHPNQLLIQDPTTGELAPSAITTREDIRSNMVESDGVIYCTDRDGNLLQWSSKGTGSGTIYLPNMLQLDNVTCTSTPVVVGNRVYLTLNGSGWDAYNGSLIVVLELTEQENGRIFPEVAYTLETAAPCQAKGIFAGVDEEGYNVIYYVENGFDGNIRVLRDREGMTEPLEVSEEKDSAGVVHKCAPILFTPKGEHANYCAVDPVFDPETGLLYVRNDSFNILAIGTAVHGFGFDSPTNTIHPKGIRTLVYKAGERVSDYEHTVTIGGVPTTNEDIVYSVDEFSAEDEVLTVSYTYGLYTGSGEKATLSEDIDVLVAETDDQYRRALAKRGDINGDGIVNAADVTLLAAHIKGFTTLDKYSFNAADVNADGKLDSADITLLAAHVKGTGTITAER